MKNNYGDSFVVGPAVVRWSHLLKPDDKFGNPHHSVTVIVDAEMQSQLDSAMQQLGGSKINGFKADAETGDNLVRFKNVLKAREGVMQFPVLDSQDQTTDTVPFATDKVRVKVTPAKIERDGSVSFYMDRIQLVERNYEGGGGSNSGGMGKVDGGYVAEAAPVATAEDDTPF
tara:strand:+ start:2095 stop:2610 length:516 start_codon:yes stop_codon:yes gene_type:complete